MEHLLQEDIFRRITTLNLDIYIYIYPTLYRSQNVNVHLLRLYYFVYVESVSLFSIYIHFSDILWPIMTHYNFLFLWIQVNVIP